MFCQVEERRLVRSETAVLLPASCMSILEVLGTDDLLMLISQISQRNALKL